MTREQVPWRVTDGGIERITAVVRHHPEYLQQSSQRARNIEQGSLAAYGARTLEAADAEAALLAWQAAIEARFEILLGQDSRYYWFFLHRRLAGLRRHGQDDRTELICDEFATLAIVRYAARTGTRFCDIVTGSLNREWIENDDPPPLPAIPRLIGEPHYESVPQKIPASNVLDLLEFDALLKDYWATTALLRRVWKGSTLVVRDAMAQRTVASAAIERMISLYDRRSDRNGILSHVGLPASLALRTPSSADLPKMAWAVHRNVDELELPLGIMGLKSDRPRYKPPFAVAPVSLTEFIAQTEPFRREIEAATTVDPWRVACFFAAVFWRFAFRCRDDFRLSAQYERVGYGLVLSRSGFLADVAPFYEYALSSMELDGTSDADLPRLADWLTYAEEPNIDLWSRTGRRVFFNAPNGVVVDLGALPSILAELALPIVRLNEAQGAVKGALFERLVEEQIRPIRHAKIPFRNEEVRDPRTGQSIGEIDVGAVRGGTLFIVECKAHSVHESWERGTPDALRYRWQVESAYLEKADKLALAIATGVSDLVIPPGVSHVVAMVVSPFASYTPDPDSRFFFTPDIPRLCTPGEAAAFIGDFNVNRHAKAPWLNSVVG